MASNAAVLEQYQFYGETSRFARYRRSLLSFIKTKPLGAFGAAVVVLLIAVALAPDLFTRIDPNHQDLANRQVGPTASHWFGTDQLGRDLFSRIVHGARTSIMIGFGVVAVSASIATILGIVSGFFGGWFDTIIQRFVDIGIALPGLIFIILVVTTFTNMDIILRIVLAVGTISSLGQSRVIRGASIGAKQNQYVEAARVLGATDFRIISRHILPNIFTVILIGISIQIGGAILFESSLSFLGYGVQPPTASWGRMLNEAREQLVRAPHLAYFPGLAIFFTVYSFNMLGDALRDVLDPRLRGSR